ncbi:MAG: hypothetical protein J6S14_05065 [Clostridia bacterium]|nr:hypothetical protein [Clostridia bacterium]
MENNKPVKPFVLRKEEAENGIFNAVAESAQTIPWCSIEDILTNLLHQVRAQAENERAIAKQSYDKAIEEYNAKEAKKEAVKEAVKEAEKEVSECTTQ